MKRKNTVALLAAALLFLSACGDKGQVLPTVDPYEGMVQVESGFGTKMWVELIEELEQNPFNRDNFSLGPGYTGEGYRCTRGMDVSEHQGEIDWWTVERMAAVDYVIIRAGYRGYSEGGLYEDAYFRRNFEAAMSTGLDIGLYFFSQALNEREAREEAQFLIELLDECRLELGLGKEFVTLPVFFDWETIGVEQARTDDMDMDTLTDCAVAFCEEIKDAGYEPGVYANRSLAYYSYDLTRLSRYQLWINALGDYPDFYYAHDFWQYSMSGNIPGIDGGVDMNFRFEKVSADEVPESGSDGAEAMTENGSIIRNEKAFAADSEK